VIAAALKVAPLVTATIANVLDMSEQPYRSCLLSKLSNSRRPQLKACLRVWDPRRPENRGDGQND